MEGGSVDSEGRRVDGEGEVVDGEGGRVDGEGGRVDNEGVRVDGEGERVDKEGGRVERGQTECSWVCSNADSSSDSWFWFSNLFHSNLPQFLHLSWDRSIHEDLRCKMHLTVELTSHSGQVEERLTGKEEGLTGKEERLTGKEEG